MELNKFEKILLWLSGKKTTFGLVAGLILSFLLGEGILGKEIVYLISGVLTAFGFTANIQTPKVYKKLNGSQ
jgi:hypothetical protein